MYFNINTNPVRPNQLEAVKDKQYHNDFARWTLNGINDFYHREFIVKSLANWSFYKGDQWIFDEDLESFFLDESGDVKNRLKWTKNLIRPMVDQYIGNAIRLAYNARAKTFGDFVINRREKEMMRLKGFQKIAQLIPEVKDLITDRVPIRDTEAETMEDFDLMFDDNLAETINNLLTYIEKDIDIIQLKIRICKFLALNGVGVYKGFESNMKYVGDAIDPMYWWFDRSARKPDLSDAAYMGEWYFMVTSSIFERWQEISKDDRILIEKSAVNQSFNSNNTVNSYYYSNMPGGKIPVYETYWKDTEQQEYAYVMDPYGYPLWTKINTIDGKYKTKDVIDPPKNEKTDKLFDKGKKTVKIYVDTLRFCIFIPSEQIGSDHDIILEYGEVPYQETYKYDPSSTQFPYKCYTWNYDKGQIITPIDDALSPQRLINRFISMAESQANNSNLQGTIIAAEAINPRDGEEGTKRAINQGKPIIVETVRTGSVQNSVGTYGSNLNNNIFTIFSAMKEFQMSLGDVTGVNDAMTGTMGGDDTLVGVVDAQIQRGSILQEPFYYALTKILEQAYQHMATVGKKVYYDSPRKMSMIVGDKGYQILTVTQDHMLEDFRIDVERTESQLTLKNNANSLIFTLLQGGLLDPLRASMLLNRATPDQVSKSLREYQLEQYAAKKEQDNINQQRMIQDRKDQQQMMGAQKEEMDKQQALLMAQDELDKGHQKDMEILKGNQKLTNTMVAGEINNRNNIAKAE
jgi:hypothetical protein